VSDLKDLAVALQQLPKRRRQKASGNVNAPLCNTDVTVSTPKQPTPPGLRRSQRITPAELLKRERSLVLNEKDFTRRAVELDERILSLSRKEAETSLMLAQVAERESTAVLALLEEHFMCPLWVLSS
jgi:hypothetical protein